MNAESLQHNRRWFQAGFFLLFLFAPVFDLFRLDLTVGHFYFLRMDWTLGLEAFQRGEMGGGEAVVNLMLRGFMPVLLVVAGIVWIGWRYGRLYCGWLCPHYSVVETINRLMQRASGRPSLWEKNPLPELQADHTSRTPDRRWWPLTGLVILFFSLLWAVVLLTYLLPPAEIYANLWHGTLTRNQFTFIAVATVLLSIEFTLARHFFCRYGCAVGFVQSLSWMANRRALVVDFDRSRSALCKSCNNACDNACPMRLKPRKRKRHMFACTQCAECILACRNWQSVAGEDGLLYWNQGNEASYQSEPPVSVYKPGPG